MAGPLHQRNVWTHDTRQMIRNFCGGCTSGRTKALKNGWTLPHTYTMWPIG